MSDDHENKTRISNLFASQEGTSPGTPVSNMFQTTASSPPVNATENIPGSQESTSIASTSDLGLTGVDSSVPVSESSVEANPFASDFKTGEASQLSMEMSAFSQFFKNGGNSPLKRMTMIIGLALLCAGGYLVFTMIGGDSSSDPYTAVSDDDDDYEDDDYGDDNYEDDEPDNFDSDLGSTANDSSSETVDDQDNYEDDSSSLAEDSYDSENMSDENFSYEPAAAGSPQLISPSDGQVRSYDETSEYALFEWESDELTNRILLSRSPMMTPLERAVTVEGNTYRLAHPWPGTWYWQVANSAGASQPVRFIVEAPVRRNVVLAPLANPLSGSSGVVSWSGDTKVARYAVEISQSGWSQPGWRYQTSGTAVTLDSVTPGQYQLRVGAYSEVSGRWEYTTPTEVTIE